jgi:hypothetical protein
VVRSGASNRDAQARDEAQTLSCPEATVVNEREKATREYSRAVIRASGLRVGVFAEAKSGHRNRLEWVETRPTTFHTIVPSCDGAPRSLVAMCLLIRHS